ncbi:hypothetical protein [Streptomyces sp. SAI-127]|uniref:hypothetical protein n=1 Tax=Streptomyces sp. SAI-127 TaxID=2940543 RepID=UPI002473352C|nr:hypothetical protein [Streptomyces sp. SAI-127]MDH6489660.1 hypothetical protein [Streptomyces sp. SAI-127]
MNMITVRPERSRLVAFARWATAQTPKVGTVGLGEFGVPADQFVNAPEDVLIGALVDGHRYVSPTEDAANGVPEPGDYDDGGQELLGVATPQALTPPLGSPEAAAAAMVAATPPEAVERAMTAALLAVDLAASNAAAGGDGSDPSDQVPEFAPLEDAPTEEGDEHEEEAAGDGGPYACDLCPREFETERGRDSHRRQVHRED